MELKEDSFTDYPENQQVLIAPEVPFDYCPNSSPHHNA